ncbi:MAG: macro domain-containing protein [Bdellovibrionales bacterium]|nr:macro domain-containing protein [Bdellovibrionales bacterium]
MIREVEGDILLSKAEALAHGVAVDDDFKQGLALQLRERWPSLYKDFRHYCQTRSPSEGEFWTWKGAGSSAIINLLTQKPPLSKGQHPGKATLSNVGHCLKKLASEVKSNGYKSLAITKLATGVGGLEWKDVKPLIDQHLGSLDIPVFVYSKYVKDKSGEQ